MLLSTEQFFTFRIVEESYITNEVRGRAQHSTILKNIETLRDWQDALVKGEEVSSTIQSLLELFLSSDPFTFRNQKAFAIRIPERCAFIVYC